MKRQLAKHDYLGVKFFQHAALISMINSCSIINGLFFININHFNLNLKLYILVLSAQLHLVCFREIFEKERGTLL